MDISVVICAFSDDRWGDLLAAVDSVKVQTVAAREIVVVIDHNEALLRRTREAVPDVHVTVNSGKRGLSDARNSGVAVASGAFIAFLDDDARADPTWLEHLRDAYESPEVVGVGGSAIPVWRSGSRPRWFPEEFDWVVGCSYRGLPRERSAIRNFLGCNMSFRREAFGTAGGFDTTVGRVGMRPVGGEETEFCIRVLRTMPRSRLIYEPAAVVYHSVPATRGRWRYFQSRCYSEGLSKAVVSGLAGAQAGLASERRHVLVTLPMGVLRNALLAGLRRDVWGLARAGAIVAGLAVTVAGYAVGRVLAAVRQTSLSTDP